MPIEEEGVFYTNTTPPNYQNQRFTTAGYAKMTNIKFGEQSNGISNLYSHDASSMIMSGTQNILGINMLEQGMADMCHGGLDDYRYHEVTSQNAKFLPFLRRANSVCGQSNGSGHLSNANIDINMYANSGNIQHNNYIIDTVLEEAKLRDLCAQEAKKFGFIVGEELEIVKAKSHRSVIQNTPDRIINSFKDRYGQADSGTKKAYLQLGVRVPSKEHVSEIVGKQGSKIKQIREKTGALITTPGEQEDHVFIIEAPPRTALHVAQILKTRAEDITLSRTVQENRRRASCPTNGSNGSSSVGGGSLNTGSDGGNVGNGNSGRHSSGNNGGRSGSLGHNNTGAGGGGGGGGNGINSSGGGGISGVGGGQSSKVILASGRIQVPKIIVGRIIGTQGSIITTIQRDTGTEIRSPPKEVGKPKHSLADFEIIVYKTSNLHDIQEANQRVLNAKQLIAHVAMHQLEKVRAEEAPYSNYQVQANSHFGNGISSHNVSSGDVISSSGIESFFGSGTGNGNNNNNNNNNNNTSNNNNNSNSNGSGSSGFVGDNNNMLNSSGNNGSNCKEHLLTEQMRPFDWIWPDVEKLEEMQAQEVVDRILEESKKKTKTKSETSVYDKDLSNIFSSSASTGMISVNDLCPSASENAKMGSTGFSGCGAVSSEFTGCLRSRFSLQQQQQTIHHAAPQLSQQNCLGTHSHLSVDSVATPTTTTTTANSFCRDPSAFEQLFNDASTLNDFHRTSPEINSSVFSKSSNSGSVDIADFSPHDFVENQCAKSKYMKQMMLNDLSSTLIGQPIQREEFSRFYPNSFLGESISSPYRSSINTGSANVGKHNIMSTSANNYQKIIDSQYSSPNQNNGTGYYSFPLDNVCSHWSFSSNNNSNSTSNSCSGVISTSSTSPKSVGSIKSYADSLKPSRGSGNNNNNHCNNHPTELNIHNCNPNHGTIGDHLKKSSFHIGNSKM